MHIVFRTDAGSALGSGHVMRCLALAKALRAQGARVRFVSRELPGHMCDLVEHDWGFTVHRLQVPPVPLLEQLGVPWEQDAMKTAGVLGRIAEPVDWLIVDHYGIDAPWEKRLRTATRRIMAIDDVADRDHECDALLDQNLHPDAEERYRGRVPASCRLLLGPGYALLRDEFREGRHGIRPRSGRVRRILVYFGGNDPGNETGKALAAIGRLERHHLHVEVVLGPMNPHREAVEREAAALTHVQVHDSGVAMGDLMLRADLAIGAGGSTTWERCCLGLPTLALAIADNQMDQAQAVADSGALDYLGRADTVSSAGLAEALAKRIDDDAWLNRISRRGMELVDGRGTERVAKILIDDDRITAG